MTLKQKHRTLLHLGTIKIIIPGELIPITTATESVVNPNINITRYCYSMTPS